jgi:hypothetical protein
MNTLIRQRRADGTQFETVIDAAPEDVQAEFDRIDGRGMMIIRDRRSDEPNRVSGNNWTFYTSSLLSFEATDRPARALPATIIESELKSAGHMYVESRGANRDELVALVQEAISAGMPTEAIAHVSGVPHANIRELTDTGTAA